MVDPQPWRNPRRAPDLAEIRAKTPAPRWLAWLWAWWPAIAWAGLIFSMSGHFFRGAYGVYSRTNPAVDYAAHDGRPVQHDSLRHSKERALHRIFCILPVAVSRRARLTSRMALDVGPRGAFLRCRLFRAGRSAPGVRGQQNRFSLRFPAGLGGSVRGVCSVMDVVPAAPRRYDTALTAAWLLLRNDGTSRNVGG